MDSDEVRDDTGDAVNEQQCESGEDLEDTHFDDNEEDRDLGLDDGFENQEVGVAEATLNEKIEIMMKKIVANEEDNGIQFVRSRAAAGLEQDAVVGAGAFERHPHTSKLRLVSCEDASTRFILPTPI
ncbi:hypothetical protein SESBI_50828 [Sesbania bispinosa]|nr:hypothetical protein SESBI_50828 [Sesbania bispinosa]